MVDELRALVFEASGAGDAFTWGWTGLVASERGLRMLHLPVRDHNMALAHIRRHYPEVIQPAEDAFLQEAARQIQAYLCGHLTQFQVELDLRGHSTFELSVWAAAARIPYGETRTYGWIAAQLATGAGAAQAVGAALGNNPVPLIVPCHRVIGADGSLVGFAGGLEMKGRLLALEAHQMSLPLTMEDATP